MDETTSNDPTGMTPEEKRRDQLLSAPGAVESDADPRIEVSEHDVNTRIDIAPDAAVRPGNPFEDPDDGALEGPDVETSPADGAPKGDSGQTGTDAEGTSPDGIEKPGGLGKEGTIPADPSGIAAGHTGEVSTFEPEEDEAAPA